MLQRTWFYGTVKEATVLDVDTVKGTRIMSVVDDEREGHILIGDDSGANKDDKGFIIFKEGGPTGGFWEFSKERPNGN